VIDIDTLSDPIREFLPKQRWYAGGAEIPDAVEIEDSETIRKEWPVLVHAVAAVGTQQVSRYQVLIGLRPFGEHAQFLEGVEEGVIGPVESIEGPAYAYDALRDPELSKAFFEHIAPALEKVEHVRTINTEQSNTSLVFDDRYIMKVYRRLMEGENPDVEITKALWDAGFTSVPEPITDWTFDRTSYAVIRGFLAGGSEGWSLALTSLRDLFGVHGNPSMAGGDFAPEAARLGEMTAEMHSKLKEVFGSREGKAGAWAQSMRDQLSRLDHPDIDTAPIADTFAALERVKDAGPAIRVHGDYHLGQVMRTDLGWYVLDFEGEPARSVGERVSSTSPLKDVAGMLRSLHYASHAAMVSHEERLEGLALAWEDHNRQAFLEGYVAKAHAAGLVPDVVEDFETVLKAFELDKAVYEVFYEQAYRPDWLDIPLHGIKKLTELTT